MLYGRHVVRHALPHRTTKQTDQWKVNVRTASLLYMYTQTYTLNRAQHAWVCDGIRLDNIPACLFIANNSVCIYYGQQQQFMGSIMMSVCALAMMGELRKVFTLWIIRATCVCVVQRGIARIKQDMLCWPDVANIYLPKRLYTCAAVTNKNTSWPGHSIVFKCCCRAERAHVLAAWALGTLNCKIVRQKQGIANPLTRQYQHGQVGTKHITQKL